MSGKSLMVGALAMQVALLSAAAMPATPSDRDTGRGFWDALACAGCAAGGIAAAATGGLEAAAITLAIGGSAAVGIASAVGVCIKVCVNAF